MSAADVYSYKTIPLYFYTDIRLYHYTTIMSYSALLTLRSWSMWMSSGEGPTGSIWLEEPSGQYFLMTQSCPRWACMDLGPAGVEGWAVQSSAVQCSAAQRSAAQRSARSVEWGGVV